MKSSCIAGDELAEYKAEIDSPLYRKRSEELLVMRSCRSFKFLKDIKERTDCSNKIEPGRIKSFESESKRSLKLTGTGPRLKFSRGITIGKKDHKPVFCYIPKPSSSTNAEDAVIELGGSLKRGGTDAEKRTSGIHLSVGMNVMNAKIQAVNSPKVALETPSEKAKAINLNLPSSRHTSFSHWMMSSASKVSYERFSGSGMKQMHGIDSNRDLSKALLADPNIKKFYEQRMKERKSIYKRQYDHKNPAYFPLQTPKVK